MMKKFIKENIKYILLLIIIALLEVLFIVRNNNIFASDIDWFKQSVAVGNYMKNLFLNTKNLFPNFAFHIGAGQNIFYLFYYSSIYSPYILISCLFSFIKMGDFLIISNILNIIITSILFYIFLIKNNYNKKISFITTLFLLSNCTFICLSHKQIMFVNYFSFLILCLFGIKRLSEKNRSDLLIISFILLAFTSYFFSLYIVLYLLFFYIYYIIKNKNYDNIKEFIFKILKYVYSMFIALLILSFLIFPILYVLSNGREVSKTVIDISYFIPKIDSQYIVYSNFGIGLTSIVWITIIYNLLFLKKENKFLSIVILILLSIPIINLKFNGGLYMHAKMYIPLIPILLIMICDMIHDIKNNKRYILLIIVTVISSILLIRFAINSSTFYRDLLLTFICLFLYKKFDKRLFLYIIVIFSFVVCMNTNSNDLLLSKEEYNTINRLANYDYRKYLNNDTESIYRFHNDTSFNYVNYSEANNDYLSTIYSSVEVLDYTNTFYNEFNNNYRHPGMDALFQDNNLFFQKFMGIRYVFMKNSDLYRYVYGYEKIADYDEYALYENKNVYSIGFASNNLLNNEEYDNLEFIEKLEAFQNNIIINGESSNSNLKFNYKKVNLDFDIEDNKNVIFKKENNHIYIESKDNNEKVKLTLKNKISNNALIIRFNINDESICKGEDLIIQINNVKNIYNCNSRKYFNGNNTFDYVISSNEDIKELTLIFTKGVYDISNIDYYLVPNEFFDTNNTIPLKIDYDKTIGDNIEGNIDLENDSYFIFSIPYDEGFKILVDNEEINIEKVNKSFIGFPLKKGSHNIKLSFKAPSSDKGKKISIIGIIIFILTMIYEIIINKFRKKNYD